MQLKSTEINFKVDGFALINNIPTIFEFFGDYFHSNPKIYKSNDIYDFGKITHGENYQKTINRLSILKNLGYKVFYIWESDFKNSLPPREF